MTLPRLAQLVNYWSDRPPAHIALRGILAAFAKPAMPPKDLPPEAKPEDFIAAFGPMAAVHRRCPTTS